MFDPRRLPVRPAGAALKLVEVGIWTTFSRVPTSLLMEGEERVRTHRVPLAVLVTTPSRSVLSRNVAFPPAWIDWVLLTVYGPPVEAGVESVKPLPDSMYPFTSEERFPRPKVRAGIETATVLLFVNLTLSLTVAKPYLSRV